MKKTKMNAFQESDCPFLRKKNVPTKVESVPKWNDQERIPLFLECFLDRSIFWNASLLPIFTFPTKVLEEM